MEAKLELARFIVRRSHGDDAARASEEHFTRVVREGEAPEDVIEFDIGDSTTVHLPALLGTVFGNSRAHWRRVITQGGVDVDGVKVDVFDIPSESVVGRIVRAGKLNFVRVVRGS
jgi:tyrosyl-tRNA synthetase